MFTTERKQFQAKVMRGSIIISIVSLLSYLLMRQEWWKIGIILLGTLLATSVRFVARILGQTKYHTEQSLLKRTEVLGAWFAENIESVTVKLWWRVFSRFKVRYYHYLESRYHYYRTQGLKTIGPEQLEHSKLFIPLRFSQTSPANVPSALILADAKGSELGIWRFLTARLSSGNNLNLAIIGRPGSGKSTLLEHLTLTYVRNTQRGQHKKALRLIPILLPLRDLKS